MFSLTLSGWTPNYPITCVPISPLRQPTLLSPTWISSSAPLPPSLLVTCCIPPTKISDSPLIFSPLFNLVTYKGTVRSFLFRNVPFALHAHPSFFGWYEFSLWGVSTTQVCEWWYHHISGGIWLDRFFFFYWDSDIIIIVKGVRKITVKWNPSFHMKLKMLLFSPI